MMKKNSYIYLVFIFLIEITISFHSSAQEKGLFLSKHYSAKDYRAASQNWGVVQDQRGVLYFANSSGILEYDGVEWRLIKVPNNSSVRSLAFNKDKLLFAGAYNELGYLTPDKKGDFTYHSLTHLLDSAHSNFGDIWNINCFSDSVFFLSDRYLLRYVNGKFDYWESKVDRFYLSHKIGQSYYVQEMGKGLMELKNDSLVLIQNGEYFSNIRIHNIFKQDNKLIICTRNEGFYIYDQSKKNVSITSFTNISEKSKNLNNFFIKNIFYHGIEIAEKYYAFSTVSGKILIIDKNWDVIDIINNESIGIKSPIHYLYYQKNHSLWLALANGISQIEISTPYRYWNDERGLNGNLTDVAQIGEKLYVSTLSGIYYTNKEKQNLNFELNSFYPVQGTFEQSWGFLYFQPPLKLDTVISNRITDKNTILLAATGRGLFQITGEKSKLISGYTGIFKSYQYRKDPSKLFLGLNNGIAMLSYKNGEWLDHGLQFEIQDMIRDISEDSLGNIWLSANYKGLIRIQNAFNPKKDSVKIEYFDTTNGLPSVNSIYFYNNDNKLFSVINWVNYTFVEKSKKFEKYIFKKDTISNEKVSNKYIDSLSGYRINEEIISNYYVTSDLDTNYWFAATSGTFRYSETIQKNYLDVSPTIIRKVLSNDSVIYYGTNYFLTKTNNYLIDTSSIVDIHSILDYWDNSLTFFFSSPFFEQESKNKYRYYLDGYDKSWSEWTVENKKEYTNLGEGDYIFKVKSKNIYQIETAVAEFKFTILPPWYRTFGAYIGYIILGILLIIFIVKLYTSRLIKERDKLETIVIERTQEILMQKEEILVQSEHLKEANEGITAQNEKLEKQKWEITNQAMKLRKANIELIKLSKVASETDNAIGIFDNEGNLEWVNDGFTRMYGFTLEQYKNEKNSNIIESSDNPNIKNAVISCLNEKKSVVYKNQTKTRDGKEIWAQTTLTHVVDKDGETINLIAIDSDITDLKLAEKKIEQQRDKLAISNATKNKFFRIIAHDLRNPISTLAGSTNLIFNDFDEYDKTQTKRFIGELNRLSQTTFHLLENLLDWSSTQMGEIHFLPKPIDLLSICKENIELIESKIDQKRIKLIVNISENAIAYADENMVKTIVRNLLSNAIKFTPDNGTIKISTHTNSEFIVCTVIDSGIGIQPKDLQKLFKIDQHHSTPGLSNEKGSGLGLILCKEFIEKNGGEINISSTPDIGTSINFTLKKHTT